MAEFDGREGVSIFNREFINRGKGVGLKVWTIES
jgi:hypothetical protein